jgi:hypothetical protein
MSLTPRTEVYLSNERWPFASVLSCCPDAISEHLLGKKTANAPKMHSDPNIRLTICFLKGMVCAAIGYVEKKTTKKSPRKEMLKVTNTVGLRRIVLSNQKLLLS